MQHVCVCDLASRRCEDLIWVDPFAEEWVVSRGDVLSVMVRLKIVIDLLGAIVIVVVVVAFRSGCVPDPSRVVDR